MTNSELNGISIHSLHSSREPEANALPCRDSGNGSARTSSPQFAHAIGEASSFQHLRLAQRRLKLLLDLTNRMISNFDVSELLYELLACIRRAMGCDAASIALLDPEHPCVFRECALDYPENGGRLMNRHLNFSEEAAWVSKLTNSAEPLNLAATELQTHAVALAEGFKSLCHFPLVRRDRGCGVLTLASLKEGAFDEADIAFLRQVASQITMAVENALAYRQIATLKEQRACERVYLEDEILNGGMFEEIVGSSKELVRTLGHVARVAPTDSTVLVTGESGTGKELVARAIHKRSRRASRPFIRVNCAAIPTSLIASELFGHEKGAFTRATERRLGRFELANSGTIFLDEIGDIPADTQIALLRVLQEREFERVGGSQPISVDVRVIAATNRDLKAAVEAGTFRLDLFTD
ncbi:MAG TPA: sigma 54-interacting transcriptional regulator [Bryobacteraceae bacterium]|nr:sigma 54-interacting transcriptional regulator [Bryobacteraceae bacterium]